ncbi:MAG: class I SAM-dependent methyltransferase [Candidatus Sericytochromatia bacterium]
MDHSGRQDSEFLAARFAQAQAYDQWFELYAGTFASEVKLLKSLLPDFHSALEIGVGSGRFAQALGISIGVEPELAMAELARKRGIQVIAGQAEALPFAENTCDFLLMVTVLCFVSDRIQSLQEAWRVTQPGGYLLIGTLDPAQSWVHNRLQKGQFLSQAKPVSLSQLQAELRAIGWQEQKCAQTLVNEPQPGHLLEPFSQSKGKGGFVGWLWQKPV